MKKRKSTDEYKNLLYDYRSRSSRHVLCIELASDRKSISEIFHDSELLRKAGNEVTAIMKKRYEQLMRTKRYRKLLKLYGETSEAKDNKKRKSIASQLNAMQKEYNVTDEYCRHIMQNIKDKYGLLSVLGTTKYEDIWKGVEKCLYENGKNLHFKKYGDYPALRAKEICSCIILKVKKNQLVIHYKKCVFTLKIMDRFQQDEVNAILNYLSQAEVIDRKAVEILVEDGICIDTYRPCYITLVPKIIRGKARIYAHITIEGKALPKYDRQGNLRHKYGKGIIGCDIGTQTIAYTSKTEVGLKNLAERGNSIRARERKERLLYRAMERSRRATNPEYYNEDGTIKKGLKHWKYSNRYKRLKAKHAELCRINSENRHLAINEDVNRIRGLGNEFITEPKNAERLKRKAKKTEKNEKGKYKRKKRFGKSIQNRCPGYFQLQVKKVFEVTGGIYREVPNDYRASQYDHTVDDYIKKKRSDRIYALSDGTEVQRDWYSSYLLYCYDGIKKEIDKEKCRKEFESRYKKEQEMIERIKEEKIVVKNSGIRVA